MRLLKAALLAACLLPLNLAAQVYNTVVFNRIGQPIAGASAAVCTAAPPQPLSTSNPCGGANATLYTDQTLVTPLASNVVTTDAYGNATIFAQPGIYWTVVYGYQVSPHSNVIAVPSGSGGTPHNLLSTTHTDTVPYTPPVLGDLIVGNGSGKWQHLAANTTSSQYCLISQGNGTSTTSIVWGACPGGAQNATYQHNTVTVGQQPKLNFLDSPTVQATATNNPGNNSVDISLTAATANPVAPPPPFAIPTGQAVAWAYPTACAPVTPFADHSFAYYQCATTGGSLTRVSAGFLDPNFNYTIRWSGFQIPTLPNDAVIQHVYPVTVATKFGGGGIDVMSVSCGSDLLVSNTQNFSGYYAASTSLGNTTGTITGATCDATSTSSFSFTPPDNLTVGIVALAVYYTTATPQTINSSTFFVQPYYPSIVGVSPTFGAMADASPINWNLGGNFIQNSIVSLNHTTTTRSLNVSNMANGGIYRLAFLQDSTGGASVTLGTGCTWIVNNSPSSTLSIPLAANAASEVEITYDGTYCYVDTLSGSGGGGGGSVSYAGAWQPSPTAYVQNQIVTANSCSWIAVNSSTGVLPGTDNGASWGLLACNGTNGANGTNGVNGTNGAPGAPGYSPNQILSGGGVAWQSGLTFVVSPTTYLIGNAQYSCPLTSLTLTASDPSLDRIDAIICNTSGVATFVTGTPSATPAPPAIDITSQIQLTFVYVAAAATTPSNVNVTDIYHENAEWTCAVSGASVVCNSTNSPHSGTYNIMYTAAATGQYAQQTIPASTVDLGQWTNLVMWVKNDATVPTTRSLVLQWYNGTTAKCTPVTIQSGNFGYDVTKTTWQQLVIPTSVFACAGNPVTRIRETVGGTGTNLTIHLDDITLQGGLAQATAPAGLSCPDWSSTATYPVNSCVYYSTTGSSYLALQTNTNKVPTNATNWKPLDIHGPAGANGNLQINQGTGAFGAFNTAISGSAITFPGEVKASKFTSTDTVDNTAITWTTGSGGDSTCPTPTLGITYTCMKGSSFQISNNGGAYYIPGSSSASGTVTSFSAGALSPLFTTSVATASTTPALSFVLSNAAAHTFFGNNTGSTGAPAYVSIGTGDLPSGILYKECSIDLGANNGSALVDADISPQITACQFPAASTVVEIDVRADGGTPNFIVSKNHLGTQTALLSSALATAAAGGRACSKTSATTSLDGSTTCSATLQNTSLAAGDYIDVTSGTAGGTAKHLTIVIHATIN